MKKRIVVFLLTMLMIVNLSACIFIEKDKEAKNEEVDYAEKYAESVYVYMISNMIKYFDYGIEIYRIDYNHDGNDDWVIKFAGDYQPFWMMFNGGCLDKNPKVFSPYTPSNDMKLFVSAVDNELYVKDDQELFGNGSTVCFKFDGQARDYCADMCFNGLEDDEAPDLYKYHVEGKTVDKVTYEKYLDSLQLKELTGGEKSFDAYISIPEELFADVVEIVHEFPFVTEFLEKDIDNDGKIDTFFDVILDENSEVQDVFFSKGIDIAFYQSGNDSEMSGVFNFFYASPHRFLLP